jgi:hypothetical protein
MKMEQIYHLSVILMFSANPPILVFPNVRDNSIKHTLINCEATEKWLLMSNFDMVQQTSLASTEYADGVNEF